QPSSRRSDVRPGAGHHRARGADAPQPEPTRPAPPAARGNVMTALAEEALIARGLARKAARRRRANFIIFLGPAIVLLVIFFIVPVLIDIAVSFTDLGRALRITEVSTANYERIFAGD